jgi:hypothetical protein
VLAESAFTSEIKSRDCDRIWENLKKNGEFGEIWENLRKFGEIWGNLGTFGSFPKISAYFYFISAYFIFSRSRPEILSEGETQPFTW